MNDNYFKYLTIKTFMNNTDFDIIVTHVINNVLICFDHYKMYGLISVIEGNKI